MIDLDNQTTLHFKLALLEEIASTLSTKEVELIITDDKTMQALNSEHRGKETSTDVLSFPMDTPFTEQSIFGMPLGSIVISETYVREKAKALGAKKLFLESNRILTPALSLYQKLGFVEMVGATSPYERSDIQMELILID